MITELIILIALGVLCLWVGWMVYKFCEWVHHLW